MSPANDSLPQEYWFSGNNYRSWSFMMKNHLKRFGLADAIEPDNKLDADKKDKAKFLMIINMKPTMGERFLDIEEPHVLWDALAKEFGITTAGDIRTNLRELTSLVYAGSIGAYFDRVRAIKTVIKNSKLSLSTIIDLIALMQLPDQFSTAVDNVLRAEYQDIDIESMRKEFTEVESRHLVKDEIVTEASQQAMAARGHFRQGGQ
ncbi:hypothetical protein FB639_004386, partial [Coemansia asiatica]